MKISGEMIKLKEKRRGAERPSGWHSSLGKLEKKSTRKWAP
jgi:hypothetical protein